MAVRSMVARALLNSRAKAARRRQDRQGLKPAHFIHIGKTGGSAIKLALGDQPETGTHAVHLHRHQVRLNDIPVGEGVFFVARDPIDRFVSGFNSRLRKGLPRYENEWTAAETTAFGKFRTPTALAEALSDDSPAVRNAAQQAFGDIRHVRDSYWRWFGSDAYLRSRRDDVMFVAFQHRLDSDFEQLCGLLGYEAPGPQLPRDPFEAHRSPADQPTTLSTTAQTNLRALLEPEYRFMDLVQELWG